MGSPSFHFSRWNTRGRANRFSTLNVANRMIHPHDAARKLLARILDLVPKARQEAYAHRWNTSGNGDRSRRFQRSGQPVRMDKDDDRERDRDKGRHRRTRDGRKLSGARCMAGPLFPDPPRRPVRAGLEPPADGVPTVGGLQSDPQDGFRRRLGPPRLLEPAKWRTRRPICRAAAADESFDFSNREALSEALEAVGNLLGGAFHPRAGH
jgi:hypothetical protein